MRLSVPLSVSLATVLVAGPAFSQATANAVVGADDAFGFIAGDEAVGIYDATAVRGFSLEAAGNYRVNGGYFVKSSGVSSFFSCPGGKASSAVAITSMSSAFSLRCAMARL